MYCNIEKSPGPHDEFNIFSSYGFHGFNGWDDQVPGRIAPVISELALALDCPGSGEDDASSSGAVSVGRRPTSCKKRMDLQPIHRHHQLTRREFVFVWVGHDLVDEINCFKRAVRKVRRQEASQGPETPEDSSIIVGYYSSLRFHSTGINSFCTQEHNVHSSWHNEFYTTVLITIRKQIFSYTLSSKSSSFI